MSNLQCPVTMILAPPGDALRLAGQLRDERISAIWCDSQTPAREAATTVAVELGVPNVRVQAANVDELESLADEFRGETVLGIVPEPGLLELLGQLLSSQSPSGPTSGESSRLSYDGEVWTVGP